jgi:hypothetical protein
LVGTLSTDRIPAFYRHLGFIMRHPKLAQGNYVDIKRSDYPIIRDIVLNRIKKINFTHPLLYEGYIDLYTQNNIRQPYAKLLLLGKVIVVKYLIYLIHLMRMR